MRKRLRKKLVNQIIVGRVTTVHHRNPVLGYGNKYRYFGYSIESDGAISTSTCPIIDGKKVPYIIGD